MGRIPNGVTKVILKNGKVQYRYSFSFDGKQYKVSGATPELARKKGTEKRAAIEHGEYIHNNAITLHEYAVEWLKRRENAGKVREKTLYEYQKILERHVFPMAGKKKIQKIERREIEKTLAAIKSEGSAYTANYCKSVLYSLFKAAKRDGIRADNPCEDIEKFSDGWKEPARETIHRALTEKELNIFFEAAQNCVYCILFFPAIGNTCRSNIF